MQHLISSSTGNNKHTGHKKRKRSTDDLSLVISIKKSKLAPLQIEPRRLKLNKKKKRPPHSPKNYTISINHDINFSSPQLQSTAKILQDNNVTVNDMVDEPVKKVKKHKEKKRDKKLLLPVQGWYIQGNIIIYDVCLNGYS